MNNIGKAFVGFAGFGGVEAALKTFGIKSVGVELNPAIADVNKSNANECITEDLLNISPSDYKDFNLLHFSPPCPNFSIANINGKETDLDIALAKKINDFITIIKPRFFTLENVRAYKDSVSFDLIKTTLKTAGYNLGFWVLNAADYGVPQTRKRLILMARKDRRKVTKPFPTHRKNKDMFSDSWVGWHEAIKDIDNNLYNSNLENNQKKVLLLKNNIFGSHIFLVGMVGSYGTNITIVSANDPSPTLTTECHRLRVVFPDNKVKSMTSKSLAALQTFPNHYKLPSNDRISSVGIGNALPPKLYQAILKGL